MSVASGQRGAVYAEFLVAFMPFFLLFLGGVQLALIAQARVVVQHAASLAARAAVVTIDDDPVFYDDGRRKLLSEKGEGKGSEQSQKIVETVSGSEAGQGSKGEGGGSERLNRVRNAAYLPLSAVSPAHEQVMNWFKGALPGTASRHSIRSTVGDAPLLRVLTGLAIYLRVASAVTFPKGRDGDELRNLERPWGDAETVRVRVTYLFPCGVPLVRVIACRSLLAMRIGNPLDALQGVFSKKKAEEKKDPSKRALEELAEAEWADMQKLLYALPNELFMPLQGEAALPNQGAAYLYPSELCKTKERSPEVDCKGKTP